MLTFVGKQQENKHTACMSIKEQVSIDWPIRNKFLNLTLPLVLKKNGITVLQCKLGQWWWSCGMELPCWMCKAPQGCCRCFHTFPLCAFALQFTASPLDQTSPSETVFLPFVCLAERPYWHIMIFLSNYCLWLLIGEHMSALTRASSWLD